MRLPGRFFRRLAFVGEFIQSDFGIVASSGNIYALEKVCCTGLANNLVAQINDRLPGDKVSWDLVKYLRGPGTFFTGVRVVSDRASQLPELKDSGIRQIVLRITSRQTIFKYYKTTAATAVGQAPRLSEAPVTKNCTEYVVIQKLRFTGEDGPWRIWGNTSASTVEDLDNPLFNPSLSLQDRLMAMRDEFMGSK